MSLRATPAEMQNINIKMPPKKRITLFFSDEEFANLEQTCLYLNSSARPLLKEIVIREIDRLHEQRHAHQEIR